MCMSSQEKGWIPPHTHCKVCGRSIPLGREYCSTPCREAAAKAQKRASRMSRLYIAGMLALMAVLLAFSLLGGRR